LKKKVKISIRGLQESEGEKPSSYRFMTEGELEETENGIIVRYTESEITGFEGTVTTYDVTPERVILTREGPVSSQMLFEEKRKHYTLYTTPFGAITMGINTLSLSSVLTDGGCDLSIHYTVDMDSSVISRNTFKINVREV